MVLKVKGPLYVINDGSDDSSSLFSDSDSGSFRPAAYKALYKSDSLSSGQKKRMARIESAMRDEGDLPCWSMQKEEEMRPPLVKQSMS